MATNGTSNSRLIHCQHSDDRVDAPTGVSGNRVQANAATRNFSCDSALAAKNGPISHPPFHLAGDCDPVQGLGSQSPASPLVQKSLVTPFFFWFVS